MLVRCRFPLSFREKLLAALAEGTAACERLGPSGTNAINALAVRVVAKKVPLNLDFDGRPFRGCIELPTFFTHYGQGAVARELLLVPSA